MVVLRGSSYYDSRTFHVESCPAWYEGSTSMALERRRILYSGAVQGVGFRWTAAAALRDVSVTGYVRNLPDGRVELLLEGATQDNDEAARRVRAAMARHIASETVERGPATGEFRDFGIRR